MKHDHSVEGESHGVRDQGEKALTPINVMLPTQGVQQTQPSWSSDLVATNSLAWLLPAPTET
jgi:hypothetical protein